MVEKQVKKPKKEDKSMDTLTENSQPPENLASQPEKTDTVKKPLTRDELLTLLIESNNQHEKQIGELVKVVNETRSSLNRIAQSINGAEEKSEQQVIGKGRGGGFMRVLENSLPPLIEGITKALTAPPQAPTDSILKQFEPELKELIGANITNQKKISDLNVDMQAAQLARLKRGSGWEP